MRKRPMRTGEKDGHRGGRATEEDGLGPRRRMGAGRPTRPKRSASAGRPAPRRSTSARRPVRLATSTSAGPPSEKECKRRTASAEEEYERETPGASGN